jgi:hypothetical protein
MAMSSLQLHARSAFIPFNQHLAVDADHMTGPSKLHMHGIFANDQEMEEFLTKRLYTQKGVVSVDCQMLIKPDHLRKCRAYAACSVRSYDKGLSRPAPFQALMRFPPNTYTQKGVVSVDCQMLIKRYKSRTGMKL